MSDLPFDAHGTSDEVRALEHIADNTATLRDQFAMAAFPAVLASPIMSKEPAGAAPASIAKFCYEFADAMMKERAND